MKSQIYCAGPMFNAAECAEMNAIARVLEDAGYATFLPQRDGLRYAVLQRELDAQGVPAREAAQILQRAVFNFDLHQLLTETNALVVNLNGRVPDEGAVAEAAMGWLSAKPVLFYKSDPRAWIGHADNPLLAGLGDFRVVDTIDAIPAALEAACAARRFGRVERALSLGAAVARLRDEAKEGAAPAATAHRLCELFARDLPTRNVDAAPKPKERSLAP